MGYQATFFKDKGDGKAEKENKFYRPVRFVVCYRSTSSKPPIALMASISASISVPMSCVAILS